MTYPRYARNTLAPTPAARFHSAPTQAFSTAETQTFHTVPTQAWSSQVAPPVPPPPAQPTTKRKRFRGPVTFLLVIVIVLAMAAAGLLGAELYARTVAVDKIKSAAACFIEASEDSVDVSFETSPPVLMQYFDDRYTGFTITTDGSPIRSVEGMTADIAVDDVDVNGDVNKRGTIGAINATIDWTSKGMRESANTALKEAIDEYLDGSIFGFLGDWISTDEVVTGIHTDASTGIVTLEGMFDSSIAVKPETTADGGIQLEIQPDGFTLGGDLDLPQEDLQAKLDEMTSELTDNEYNLRADSLEVSDSGVTARFSASNIDIPASDGESGCFDM
ncbi:MAG: DUF2993 domain-containing protein [Mycobacterium sp.]